MKEKVEGGHGSESAEAAKEIIREKIPEIISGMDSLEAYYNYDNGWYSGDDEEGHPVWNHWSAGLDRLKKELGRDLSDGELTAYSLSLCYGPLPVLDDQEAGMLYKEIWPDGNQRGFSLSPDKFKEKLSKF